MQLCVEQSHLGQSLHSELEPLLQYPRIFGPLGLFISSKVFIQNLILAAGYIMNKSALFQNGWKCVLVGIADEVQAELRHITGKFWF